MIKLNRSTEYGLIALRYIGRKQAAGLAEVSSAREIAEHYGLPFEVTAKTLQRLKELRLIDSAQGPRGGYTLVRPLKEIHLAEFLIMMEGPQALVACIAEECECEYEGRCEIKGVMTGLSRRITQFLSGIRLSELSGDCQLAFPDTQNRASLSSNAISNVPSNADGGSQ